jgi:hypothetical protein
VAVRDPGACRLLDDLRTDRARAIFRMVLASDFAGFDAE